MPDLVCSAQNCRYNDSMYCCKGDIQVGGEEAKDCRDTCCESFHERTTDSVKDSCGCGMRPDQRIDIRCEAVNCEYNDECVCHADHENREKNPQRNRDQRRGHGIELPLDV